MFLRLMLPHVDLGGFQVFEILRGRNTYESRAATS
jgi:hypothetical protein